MKIMSIKNSWGGRGRGWGRGVGGEMTKTMYAHVNKRIINFLKKFLT
jgi:hypothetical protein